MAIARKIFMWLAIDGAFAAAVWFGFVQDAGITAALTTLRANLKTPNA